MEIRHPDQATMGCVQAKASPVRGLNKVKLDNGYVKGAAGDRPIIVRKQDSGPLKKASSGKAEVNSEVVAVVKSKPDGEGGGGSEKKIGRQGEEGGANGGVIGRVVSKRITLSKKISTDELIDGWPKWLLDNIPSEVLAGLVRKTADSYDKVAKVSIRKQIVEPISVFLLSFVMKLLRSMVIFHMH